MRRAIALAALLAGARGRLALVGSDRRRVNARFDEAISLFEKSGRREPADAFARVRGIVGLFAPGFVAMARPYEGTITDAQQLAGIVASYRSSAERISIGDSGARSCCAPTTPRRS